MDNISADIRYALRSLAQRPGFTLAAATTLALGIGVNTAIFSVINAVLLRPLPFPESNRLVMVWQVQQVDPNRFPDPNGVRALQQRWWVNNTTFDRWKELLGPFEAMAGFRYAEFGLSGAGEPVRAEGAFVSAAFFPLLGVKPILGRTFVPEEDRPRTGPVAILSHGLWLRRFGGSPGALGAKILLDGVPHTVVGILPPSFEPVLPDMSRDVSVWVPLSRDITAERPFSIFLVAARLKRGLSLRQAQDEQSAFAQSLHKENPRRYRETGVNLVPMTEELSHSIRPALLLLWIASAFVLLIAAVNLANLLLARAITRQREIGIRAVLGAGRWRLARHMLLEGAILAVFGGTLGMLASTWGTGLLVRLAPQGIVPRTAEINADAQVLGLGLLISMTAGLLAALLPAWNASRSPQTSELNEVLKEGSRSSSSKRTRQLRAALVVCQVALACILMAGAGLLIRSFSRLTGVDPGFRPHNILTAGIVLPEAKYRQPAAQFAFAQSVLERIQALPGVETAAVTNSLPITPQVTMSTTVEIEGGLKEAPVYLRSITPDYFRLMGVRIEKGRPFASSSTATETVPVNQALINQALINQAMLRRYWPQAVRGSAEPLGRRINVEDKWREIVGVVSDIKHDGLAGDTSPEVYLTLQAMPSRWLTLVVRGAGDPMRFTTGVRNAVWAVDRDQPLQDIQSLEHVIYSSVTTPRFRMVLLVIFAALALALATIGIYAVVAFAVTERTREIGIRMTLGARRADVLRMVVRDGLRLAALGAAIGIGGSVAATRLLAGFLFGIQPTDTATLIAVSTALIAVAVLASYLPARRATKVDPVNVLRWE